jgi:F0F1-type ATP synthase assembly protein I
MPPVDVSQRRELARDMNRQSGSFELAITPVLFGAVGYLLDRWLGIVPIFTLILLLVAFGGVAAKLWRGYDREMRLHEENGPWARHR